MADRAYHLARAEHNLKASTEFNDTPYTDWAVTSLFYSALHLAHAFLAGEFQLSKDERHPRKHTANANPGNGGRGCNQLVAALLPEINKEYRSLFEGSYRSRYDAKLLVSAEFNKNAYKLYLFQYQNIKLLVNQRIKEQDEV